MLQMEQLEKEQEQHILGIPIATQGLEGEEDVSNKSNAVTVTATAKYQTHFVSRIKRYY